MKPRSAWLQRGFHKGRHEMRILKSLLVTAGIIAGIALPASAHEYRIGEIEIMHPVIRATPPTANVAAGYMLLMNSGTESDRLVGGSAEFAESFEVHEMRMDGDVMQMREIEGGLEIEAGGEVLLERGGYHVMFIGLKEQMVAGENRDVRLVFEKAGEIEVQFSVEEMQGMHSH